MTTIPKITIETDGATVAFGVPFSKVNVKDRTVEGFATLDNVDKGFDIVDFNASVEAFNDWVGNIREMHGPVAVGKAIQIEERTLDHAGKTYKGIWVKARISKGAEDTWQKILDGTLAGYSIGGRVLERRPEVVKGDGGRYSETRVNRITKYMLGELSVVDNPMNPLAMLAGVAKGFLIKMDGDEMVAGDALLDLKGMFYCSTCDTAKMDDPTYSDVECVTCDGKAIKIADVAETPNLTEMKKFVDEYLAKADSYNHYETETGEAGFGVPSGNPDVAIETANPDLVVQVAEATPQIDDAAPHAEKATPTLDAQTAEGTEIVSPEQLAEVIAEALKSRVEFTGRSHKKKENADVLFVETLVRSNPSDFKFPLDSEPQIRASVVYFNAPGQRAFNKYSFGDWAELGKSIASAANEKLGEGHEYRNGKIVGPSVTKADAQRGELILNLQKNATDDNNDIVNLLQSLVGYLHEDNSPIQKGGDNQTLDTKGLEKILEVLEAATSEVRDIVKGFSVENLNNENGSGPSVGGPDAGEIEGIGTDSNPPALATAEVEVAAPASMPTPDNGPDKVVPAAIDTDGTGIGQGITSDSGPEKVLPHADLASVAKAEGSETEEATTDSTELLLKGMLEKIEGKFDEFAERLDSVEKGGAGKKSAELDNNELKKSADSVSTWGGMFYNGELADSE